MTSPKRRRRVWLPGVFLMGYLLLGMAAPTVASDAQTLERMERIIKQQQAQIEAQAKALEKLQQQVEALSEKAVQEATEAAKAEVAKAAVPPDVLRTKGGEYDSLSDMIAFGLAPGLVMYLWALQPLGKFGWFAAFVYVAGAALRLARFNSQMDTADKRYFTGLPSPSAAAVVAGAVWVSVDYEIAPELVSIPAGILTLLAGLAMLVYTRARRFMP